MGRGYVYVQGTNYGRPRNIVQHALVTVLLSVIALVPSARAQETFPIRVGVILPLVEGEGIAAQFDAAVREAARHGVEMATEELGINAEMLGFELTVLVEAAADPDTASDAARSLVEEEEVLALVGGYGEGVAQAIAALATESGVPFLNIGSSSPTLRNEECSAWMFHIEPSGGMYLDALAGWFVGSGFRDWHLILDGSPQNEILADRFEQTLRQRHFGARVRDRVIVEDEASYRDALEAGGRADVILLFPRGEQQLELLRVAEELGVDTEITAFPWSETQTREYYDHAAEVAPGPASHRASAWEPTLDAYGARELNARFEARYGETMDAPAWSAYQAVKLVFEAVVSGGVRDRQALRDHFSAEETVFDVWKGIGVTFRPWNNQLRQTLFLVELRPGSESERDAALLVGELPSIYMPRTDPVERLDQLGDLQDRSRCRF